MGDIDKDSRVLSLGSRPGLRQTLVTLLDQLSRCQKALNEFLEVQLLLLNKPLSYLSVSVSSQEKRAVFPRFYFLGDDDLLEILGQATKPQVIQVYSQFYPLHLILAHYHTVVLVCV